MLLEVVLERLEVALNWKHIQVLTAPWVNDNTTAQ